MKKHLFLWTFLLLIFISPSVNAQDYLIKFSDDVITLFPENSQFERVAPSVGIYATTDKELAEQMLEEGIIEYMEEDEIIELFDDGDPYYSNQWNMLKCNIPAARRITRGSSDVTVGIIDSGIQTGHPDFAGNILTGYNSYNSNSDANDDYGHGTAIAGIIGAAAENGRGITGIADQTKILPIRCGVVQETTKTDGTKTKTFGLSVKSVEKGIQYAIDHGCDVINLSLGAPNWYQSWYDIIQLAYEKNIIVVAAVGNSGGTALSYPAAFDNVIGVGSINKESVIASTSRHNKSVFVCAPGVSIFTTISKVYSVAASGVVESNYAYVSGTSFAAPHVSALAALAKSIDPDITPDSFSEYLKLTAQDLGEVGWDEYYGYGLIDMAAVLEKVKEAHDLPLVTLPSLYPLSGSELTLESDGKLTRSIINNTDEPISGKIITAFSDKNNNPMSAPKTEDISILPHSTFLWESDFTVPNNSPIKQFFWDETNIMQPLLPTAEYNMK